MWNWWTFMSNFWLDCLLQDIQVHLVPLEYDDSISLQKQILINTVHHPIAQKYPATLSYTRLFLKGLISMVKQKCI